MAKAAKRGKGRPRAVVEKLMLTARVDPELIAALDRAAEKKGQSRSQEVERRLRNSFDAELQLDAPRKQLRDFMGGPQGFALVRLLGEIIHYVQQATGKTWNEDGQTAREISQAFYFLINSLAPKFDDLPDQHTGIAFTEFFLLLLTNKAQALKMLRAAEGTEPEQWLRSLISAIDALDLKNAKATSWLTPERNNEFWESAFPEFLRARLNARHEETS